MRKGNYMPKFGALSEEHLRTCDPRLQILFREVVQTYDCKILCGHRDKQAQDAAFAAIPQKSKLQGPNGRHNAKPSMAVDVSPYPIEWSNQKRFYHFAGYVQGKASEMGIKIRFGGDWDRDFDLDDQDFMDLVHFELINE